MKARGDLLSCVGTDRERFEKQICRLLSFPVRMLVVEMSWAEIRDGQWETRVSPEAVRNTLLGLAGRGIPVLPAGSREAAGLSVREFLLLATRRRWREARALLGSGKSACPF